MSKTVAVIDGNSLMHRAFHAVPPTMTAPDGTPTNAVFGFFSMFLKFVELAQPDAVICAFDAGRPAIRMQALEQYKAQRPPMDPDLRVQFPVIEELLTSMGVPVVKIPGWEGDDILGTVAARDEALGFETLLVTGDKDACQLATNLTRIVTTKKGITDVAIFGPAEVYEKYGVTPAQFPDFLGLMGDSSDNIPGVPGIGPKTAAKLLQQFDSIEGLYENLDKLKGKQLEKIRDNKDAAFVSREVATIITDLDFELDIENVQFPDFDPETVSEAFGKYRLRASLDKVLRLMDAECTSTACVQLSMEPVERGGKAAEMIDAALSNDELVGVAFAESSQESLFSMGCVLAVSTQEGIALFEDEDALERLAMIVRTGKWAVLDGKSALRKVYPADTSEPALVSDDELMAMRLFDAGLAGYVLNSSISAPSIEHLVEEYLGGQLPEAKSDEERAVMEAVAVRALVDPMNQAMEKDGCLEVFQGIDMPLVAVLAIMERTGAAIDAAKLAELGAQTGVQLEELRAQAYELAGEEFNLDSPKQLSHILFEVLSLPPKKKTSRGYSTDASVLKDLAKEHELPALILRYREMAKIKSTYIDALPRMRAGDGRVHTSFNQTVTTTGRLSSSEPNLQNIPVRTEFGRQIRECFVPLEPGCVFMSADYSQIELRLLAHLSADEKLVEAFCSGADFHAATAANVFGLTVDQVTPDLRSRAKAVNFGIVYGQQAFGLSQSLGIPFGEAKEMIDRYFEAHPGVREYLDSTVDSAKSTGYAETMFGRKRHIPELRGNAMQRGFGERTAMNHPMQGSAADIIKLAMRKVLIRMREENLKAKLLLQVHDELDFSVPEDEIDVLSSLVKEEMEKVVNLRVPLEVDVQWSATWAGAH